MFKNLVLAILIAMVLTYTVGHVATEWLDVHISLSEHEIEPFSAVIASVGVVALLVAVGFVVALSVFATVVFVIAASMIGLLVAGFGLFWPVLLFGVIIYLLVRDKSKPTLQY